jgi:NADPH-dependent 2,4-dienoyl-CoA reductase/sulfur reductase-like enzyme
MEGREVEMQLGRTVAGIDRAQKQAVDDQGNLFSYQKLLLATGGQPRLLPLPDDRLIYFRTLADYQRLRCLTETAQRFAVIGGGFIGSEIAAALTMVGKQVVLICAGAGLSPGLFPADLSQFVTDYYRQKGVDLLSGQTVTAISRRGSQLALQTSGQQEILVDGAVAGIGMTPNTALAESAGLAIDDGIRVDASLRTSDSDIYAAGDVARFYNPSLDSWLRVEHEDNANTMGRLAGAAMAGAAVRYDHLPSFYSDLFDLGYEAVGEIDAQLQTVADWKHPFREGVVYYLRDQRVRGVLLWNVWEQVEAARQLIASTTPVQPADLKGRLPV